MSDKIKYSPSLNFVTMGLNVGVISITGRILWVSFFSAIVHCLVWVVRRLVNLVANLVLFLWSVIRKVLVASARYLLKKIAAAILLLVLAYVVIAIIDLIFFNQKVNVIFSIGYFLNFFDIIPMLIFLTLTPLFFLRQYNALVVLIITIGISILMFLAMGGDRISIANKFSWVGTLIEYGPVDGFKRLMSGFIGF